MDKIAVLIPCYNEAKTIRKVVRDWKNEIPEAVIYVYDNKQHDGAETISVEILMLMVLEIVLVFRLVEVTDIHPNLIVIKRTGKLVTNAMKPSLMLYDFLCPFGSGVGRENDLWCSCNFVEFVCQLNHCGFVRCI